MYEDILISVVMPAHNGSQYIRHSLDSVLAQTHSNIEVIVIDDCSSDDTFEIVETYSERDSRVRLVKNDINIGAGESRNKAVAMCRGEYVALIDHDDIWREDKLEKQLASAKENDADIVYCSYELIDDKGNSMDRDFIVPVQTSYRDFLSSSVISCSTAFLKRGILERYKFPAGVYHEDLLLWLKLLRDGNKAVGLSEVLASYRVHAGSKASNKINAAKHRWKIFKDELGIPFTERVRAFAKYAVLGVKKYK